MERVLIVHTQEVTGSSPVAPTIQPSENKFLVLDRRLLLKGTAKTSLRTRLVRQCYIYSETIRSHRRLSHVVD
jgi:hypothetical protein